MSQQERNFPSIKIYILVVNSAILTRFLVQNLERLNHLVRHAFDDSHASFGLLLKVAQVEWHVSVFAANLCDMKIQKQLQFRNQCKTNGLQNKKTQIS